MATYKKRASKDKRAKSQKDLVEEQSTTAEVFNTLDETAGKTEAWVAKNQKYIFIFIGVIALGVLGYLGYNEYVQKPKEKEAANEVYQANEFFQEAMTGSTAAKDSLLNLALNGGEGKFGLIDIIENYSGTKAANLANYSAGIAYLNLKDYTKAIEHLSDFSSDNAVYGAVAKGSIGDAFMQLNQPKDALEYYEKAIAHNANDFTTPKYLLKAGIAALEAKDFTKASDFFNRIKEEFENSTEARNIDVYIGRASTTK
ncbi:tetratricopeptide repeat protein [Spongiivirga sp. MCCC 1A20706]|uniref:tetratricopeptide repeat protein n=1 Tax=Spongiivirga sp. MCCC 1A20706 TaxID=3160963 RepID=UPI0039774BCF